MSTKLNQLRPVLGTLPPRLGPAPGNEQARNRYRSTAEPWRAWYQTARWKRLRLRVFARDLFTCRECGKVDGNTSRLVAHHVEPHKGDEVLFWNEDNIQCICQPCHDGPVKARERSQSGNSR